MPKLRSDWVEALGRFDKAQRFEGISDTTRATRRGHVSAVGKAADVPLADVSTFVLQSYLDRRAMMPSTRRNYVKSWRAFWRWLYESGYGTSNPALDLHLSLSPEQATAAVRRARQVTERPRTGPEPWEVPAEWADWITAYRRYSRVGGSPESTTTQRTYTLSTIARAMKPVGPAEVSLDDLLDWLVTRDWTSERRRSVRSTLRKFYQWAQETGRIDDNPADKLPVVRKSQSVPKPATESAYQFALTVAPPRERLMLRFAAELGLRRAEVAGLHTSDVLELDYGRALVVRGKGDKQRVLPLSDSLAAELRQCPPGWIFPSAHHDGHLSARYVGTRVREHLPPGVTMHALRHRFATVAYDQSRDLLAVQQLLGHSSPATTQSYVALSERSRRDIVTTIERMSRPGFTRFGKGVDAP